LIHKSGKWNESRSRSAGNGVLFDKSVNIEGLRLKGRMENGYEEGCTRGAKIQSADFSGSYLTQDPVDHIQRSAPRDIVDIEDGAAHVSLRQVDVRHPPIPAGRFDALSEVNGIFRNPADEIECLDNP